MIPDFTTIVAVDKAHLWELHQVWPTWRKFKPEIFERPIDFLCDTPEVCGEVLRCVRGHGKACAAELPPNTEGIPQRERMLTALVRWTEHIGTPYYLKLDTDTAATAAGQWYHDWWFDGEPVMIAPRWGYTKPASMLDDLDRWAATVPSLANTPAVARVVSPRGDYASHQRIISYCQFGRTDWTRQMSALAPGRLPCPSQDTFLSYVAARRGDFVRHVQMRNHGWLHVPRERLAEVCHRVLGEQGEPATAA